MKKNAKIYVAGHTGLVGSAIVRLLKTLSYPNIITRTHRALDLTDKKKVESFFSKERPDYVILAAARVGGIHANATYPAEFIFENLSIQNNVIDLAFRYKVKKLMFLTSSCVYPKICKQPMREEYLLTGSLEPTNQPFAVAKLSGIQMCQAYRGQYGAKFISVIPANVYGINDHFDENGHVLAALMAKFHRACIQKSRTVSIWGTGKPRREFLFVDDLADACVFLLKNYDQAETINVGIGQETSIASLARKIKKISGFQGELVFDLTKPDGNPRRFLDSSEITAMGWEAETPLEQGLKVTWEWYKKTLETTE
jgi:GDP-L-fucose synthase